MKTSLIVSTIFFTALTGACTDDDGSGSVTVLLEAEDTITEGLGIDPSEEEHITDGWEVTFSKYVVAIGALDIHLATDEEVEREDDGVIAYDLTKTPAGGASLWSFMALPTGTWNMNYQTPAATSATTNNNADEADFNRLKSEGLTYIVAGSMTKTDGETCPPNKFSADIPNGATPNGNSKTGADNCYDNATITFEFGVEAATQFGPCEVDEKPGFAIADGATQTVALTIHGDHIFFNGFPEGDEGGVMRLAQWLADADLNLDGTVTMEELTKIVPADMPGEFDNRFQLGGAPIDLTNLAVYVKAQLKTQGHFQGEGECAVDGEEHDHGE